MLPTKDTAIVADGIALLIGQYKGKPNITAFLEACLGLVQDAENTLWQVIDSQLLTRTFPAGTAQGQLSGPPDQALLQVAELVGCPTGTFLTSQLAFLIGIWILARKSQGSVEDILGILAVAFGKANVTYEEYWPATFQVWDSNIPDVTLIEAIADALEIARPPGVYAVLAWGNEPATTFFFGDFYGATSGSGLGDSYSMLGYAGLLEATEV